VNNGVDRPNKSPVLAAFLSLLLGGLGQFYNGEIGKGLCFLVVEFIAAFATMGMGYIAVMLVSTVDAYASANRINNANKILKRGDQGQGEHDSYYIKDASSGKNLSFLLKELGKLKDLNKSGILSESEVISKKASILSEIEKSTVDCEIYDMLSSCGDLRESEAITDEDFQFVKMKILGTSND
jgi:TM2 domain-containing membrane protein YozV